MNQRFAAIILLCIAAVLIAGCTVQQQPAGSTTPVSGTPLPAVMSTATVSTAAVSDCSRDEDCVPSRADQTVLGNGTSIHITATPQRYSPTMSSTPGIGLTVTPSGFTAADAVFSWNASYGEFLSWNPPDYKVIPLNDPVTNHGEELYWSFTDKPVSTATPVIITVVAKDPDTGTVIGTSQTDLAWDGDFAVTVQQTP
jgi:ABC-type Fe3+-hydroxamate transport system substrate-binding protein